MDAQLWNERYSQAEYVYGTEPNEFLASVAEQIPQGPVLSLAEGEGRNGLFLASLGYDVTGVDQSEAGLAKAKRLAEERGLQIRTQQADLAEYRIEPGTWAGVVSIFCHLPPAVRVPLYAAVVHGLRPGGVIILEAYTPQQLGRGTGGPQSIELLASLDDLHRELAGLEFLHAQELEREVREGQYHTGLASVVQVVARRSS